MRARDEARQDIQQRRLAAALHRRRQQESRREHEPLIDVRVDRPQRHRIVLVLFERDVARDHVANEIAHRDARASVRIDPGVARIGRRLRWRHVHREDRVKIVPRLAVLAQQLDQLAPRRRRLGLVVGTAQPMQLPHPLACLGVHDRLPLGLPGTPEQACCIRVMLSTSRCAARATAQSDELLRSQGLMLRRGRPRFVGGFGSSRAAIMRSSAASHSSASQRTTLLETLTGRG